MGDPRIDIKKQKVDEDFNEGVSTDPRYLPEFITDNFLRRSLSYMFGWVYGTDKPVKLACTSDGALRTATTTTALETNDTKAGNAADAYGALIEFDLIASRADVFAFNNALMIKLTLDGLTFRDEIEIPADSSYSIDCRVKGFKVKNETVAAVSRYQIVGWF